MSVYFPEATPALATTKVKVTASVADPAAPKLATEINAVTSKDVTLTVRAWDPQVTANSGNAPTRLGTKTQMPQEGLSQYAGIEVRYPVDPQADDTDPDNLGMAAFPRGVVKDVVVRKGPDAVDEVFAIGDRAETWRVRCGRPSPPQKSGDDEFAEWEVVQMLYPIKEEGVGVVVA